MNWSILSQSVILANDLCQPSVGSCPKSKSDLFVAFLFLFWLYCCWPVQANCTNIILNELNIISIGAVVVHTFGALVSGLIPSHSNAFVPICKMSFYLNNFSPPLAKGENFHSNLKNAHLHFHQFAGIREKEREGEFSKLKKVLHFIGFRYVIFLSRGEKFSFDWRLKF